MVTPSKTCVRNFQDLPCGREFIDVAMRRLRSPATVTPAQSTKPNRRERYGKQAKQGISRSVHGGDAITEPRGVDYIEAGTQRTPGSEKGSCSREIRCASRSITARMSAMDICGSAAMAPLMRAALRGIWPALLPVPLSSLALTRPLTSSVHPWRLTEGDRGVTQARSPDGDFR